MSRFRSSRLGRHSAATAVLTTVGALALGTVGVTAAHAADGGADRADGTTTPQRGGTLTVLSYFAPEHLDPQRLYVGSDIADLQRLTYRSLVAFPSSTDRAAATTPVPDLATTTGSHNAADTVWRFTLKKGVRWQDDQPVTCADLKYGISRSFATDVITGGPNYILGYLDVPTNKKTGQSIYTGPYQHSTAGEKAFDRAVTCHGRTITYRFKKPWVDFPLAIAALPAFDPFRSDQDKGSASDLSIFSDGPYELKGKVHRSGSFTLVRNPAWNPSTDQVRHAYPDQFDFRAGVDPDTQYDGLIKDSMPDAITNNSVPSADYARITGSVAARSTKVTSPYTDYLLPNFNSPTMKNPKVRRALAQATDREGWSAAIGGPKASRPSWSIVNPAVPGYRRNPAFKHLPVGGAPALAHRTLKASGLALPVPIRFTYPGGTPAVDHAAKVLKRAWTKAGFKVTLDSLDALTYYATVQNPRAKTDVAFSGWGADWPSISTVIPPNFDSRINLRPSSNGEDFGNFHSDAVNRAIDAAGRKTDRAKDDAAWAKVDATLGKDTAYVPLDIDEFYFLRGSDVAGYTTPVSTSSYPDLAGISLTNPDS